MRGLICAMSQRQASTPMPISERDTDWRRGASPSDATRRAQQMALAGAATPSSVGSWPTMIWTEMPARKPVVTGTDSRSASQPARSSPTPIRTRRP